MFLLSHTGEAESITTHYLLCLGLYRAFYLLNWIYRYLTGSHPEAVVVLAGILQTALYSDFFYIYYKRYTRSTYWAVINYFVLGSPPEWPLNCQFNGLHDVHVCLRA